MSLKTVIHYRYSSCVRVVMATLMAGLVTSILVLSSAVAIAEDNLKLNVFDEAISIQRFPASGDQLILYVAPGYGFNDRGRDTARALAQLGIEVWMVDLIDSYFKTYSVDSIREFDGTIVANIIEQAHASTGKNITLLTSSYGAIPLLKGARQWQLNNSGVENVYLNGAILFSPELYMGVPELGEDPEFEAIASATNIPLMIYQSELRNNRWQLENLVQRLEKSHAVIYQKIIPRIASFFYQLTDKPDDETSRALNKIPGEVPKVVRLLQSTPTPLKAASLEQVVDKKTVGLDFELRKYTGDRSPKPLDLQTLKGERIVRRDYRNKVTVVNFWATWCPPCVEEIPMLNRLQEKMKGENFELLSVNYGEPRDVIHQFIKQVNIEFPVLLDEGALVSGQWNTLILPSTFVIGPNGEFAYTVNAAIEWDSPDVVRAMKQLATQ